MRVVCNVFRSSLIVLQPLNPQNPGGYKPRFQIAFPFKHWTAPAEICWDSQAERGRAPGLLWPRSIGLDQELAACRNLVNYQCGFTLVQHQKWRHSRVNQTGYGACHSAFPGNDHRFSIVSKVGFQGHQSSSLSKATSRDKSEGRTGCRTCGQIWETAGVPLQVHCGASAGVCLGPRLRQWVWAEMGSCVGDQPAGTPQLIFWYSLVCHPMLWPLICSSSIVLR